MTRFCQIAAKSTIANYDWADRGVAPLGYIKGMAVVYAMVYCKLKAGDTAAKEMSKENTGDADVDALALDFGQDRGSKGMNAIEERIMTVPA